MKGLQPSADALSIHPSQRKSGADRGPRHGVEWGSAGFKWGRNRGRGTIADIARHRRDRKGNKPTTAARRTTKIEDQNIREVEVYTYLEWLGMLRAKYFGIIVDV